MRWPAVLAVCLVMASAVGAAPASQHDLHAQLVVTGKTHFIGETNLSARSAGIVYEPTLDDRGTVNLSVDEGRIKVLNLPYAMAGFLRSPTGGERRVYHPMATEVLEDHAFAGTIELLQPLENATYRFLPLEEAGTIPMTIRGPREMDLLPPLGDDSARRNDRIPGYDPNINRSLWPRATAARLTDSNHANLSLSGDLFVLFSGGRLVLHETGGATREIWSTRHLNESRTATDPSGNAGVWYYDQLVVLVTGGTIHADLTGADPKNVEASFERLTGTWNGDLTFSGVTGTVRVDGQDLRPEPALFQTIGDFQSTAAYSGNKGTWAFEGPATFVGINGLTVVGDRLAHLQQTVWTVVGGVTLLGLLVAALTPAGRAFLGGILGRNEAEPLGHPLRKLLLKSIAQAPGITRSQLARETKITRLLARYHLRILRRAGLIDTVRTGRQVAFALNDASYRFPLEPMMGPPQNPPTSGPPAPAVLAVHALAALNGPVRRRIHQALTHAGPCSYDDMTQAWRDLQAPQPWPSRSQVSRHATALLRAGLLERRRTGKRIQWALTVDLAGVRSTAMMRVLSNAKNRLVFDLATQQPRLSRDEIVERFAQTYATRPASTVDTILLKLEYAGLLPGGSAEAASSRLLANAATATPG